MDSANSPKASPKSSPKSPFTPKQTAALAKNGYTSLYSIITNFPFRYEQVIPIDGEIIQEKTKYLLSGEIASIQKTPRYYLISIKSDYSDQIYNCYYFVKASFVSKLYFRGTKVQAEIGKQKNFVTITKMAVQKPDALTNDSTQKKPLVLGALPQTSYITPVYNKVGALTSSQWIGIHQRLEDHNYILQLEGLLPSNQYIPTVLDLKYVHKPTTLILAYEKKRQFMLLRIFLKLAQNQYALNHNTDKIGTSAMPDKEFLSKLSLQLPFSLSLSQKQVIWEIINGFAPQDTFASEQVQKDGLTSA